MPLPKPEHPHRGKPRQVTNRLPTIRSKTQLCSVRIGKALWNRPKAARCPAPWVDGLTIAQVLVETARANADRDALVFPALGLKLS